ncbi:MAG TPA: site-specific integrase [Tepidisphaeraceae bacterium]
MTNITTLQALRDEVVDRRWSTTKACATQETNSQEVVTILGPDKHPAMVNRVAVDALERELEKRSNSDATINRKLSTPSVMLRHAQERGWITNIPTIKRRREMQGRIRWISLDEEAKVLVWFHNMGYQSMHDLCVVLLDSEFRLSEALGLRWEDITHGQLTLHPGETKNDLGRAVKQTDRVAEIVIKRKREGKNETRLFWDLTIYSVRHIWDKMKAALSLSADTEFVPHCLRHTTCSRLVQEGTPLYDVQRFMGHQSMTFTQRYAHLAPANFAAATQVLNGFAHGLNWQRPEAGNVTPACDTNGTETRNCDRPVMRIAK